MKLNNNSDVKKNVPNSIAGVDDILSRGHLSRRSGGRSERAKQAPGGVSTLDIAHSIPTSPPPTHSPERLCLTSPNFVGGGDSVNAVDVIRRLVIVLLLLTVMVATGCTGIKANREADFLKPLASSSTQASKAKLDPMPSERMLCMETAKTVGAKGHATEAIKLYERAEQIDSDAAPLDAKLAPLYAADGMHTESIERYRRSVQVSPDDVELSNNLAWTLMEAESFDQAAAEANRGLQHDPKNVRLLSTLAIIRYRQGDRAGALQLFEKAQGESAAHHNLAILDIDAGDIDSAKTQLQLAKQSAGFSSNTELLITALESETSTR